MTETATKRFPLNTHIATFLNSILAKGYSFPRNCACSGNMFHFYDGVTSSVENQKNVTLALCYGQENDYYFCYTNTGGDRFPWQSIIACNGVSESKVARILEHIWRNLNDFLSEHGNSTTINSALISAILNE